MREAAPRRFFTRGLARAGKYTPSVIQCKNAGHDGFDVQWECRADLDNAYRCVIALGSAGDTESIQRRL